MTASELNAAASEDAAAESKDGAAVRRIQAMEAQSSVGVAKRLAMSFSDLAGWAAEAMGSASAFVIATAACLLWAVSGPIFHYSDTWQLVINTATTVLTFLAVFLIQHSQNKDGRAIQLKLDELIRSTAAARNRLINLEHCTSEELEELQSEFSRLQPETTKAASE